MEQLPENREYGFFVNVDQGGVQEPTNFGDLHIVVGRNSAHKEELYQLIHNFFLSKGLMADHYELHEKRPMQNATWRSSEQMRTENPD